MQSPKSIFAPQGGGFRQASAEDLNDIFNGMFGGGGGGGAGSFADMFEQQRRMRGPDLQAQMRISLREAAEGVSRTVQIPFRSISGKRESRAVKVDIPAGRLHLAVTLFQTWRVHAWSVAQPCTPFTTICAQQPLKSLSSTYSVTRVSGSICCIAWLVAATRGFLACMV